MANALLPGNSLAPNPGNALVGRRGRNAPRLVDYTYPDMTPTDTIKHLANSALKPAQYMTPGVGDYMALEDAGGAYKQAYNALTRGRFVDAAGYAAGGIADSLSAIPGIGDAAMLAKGASIPLAALMTAAKGSRLPMDEASRMVNLPKYVEPENALVVQHKLTQDNLRNADRMGGLPMPSVAVARLDTPMEGYGDITLVGDKSMAKPGARNPVYSADAYSPTYPPLAYKYSDESLDRLNTELAPYRAKFGDSEIYRDSLDNGAQSLRNQRAVMAKFLDDNGVKIDPSGNNWELESSMLKKIGEIGREKYNAYADDLFKSLGAEEKLFFGYTDLGNRQYKPHTLDNVVKYMRREMKDNNQTSMFGSGALRAQVAPKFRKLSDVQNARDRIRPPAELDEIKGELNERLIDVSSKFDEYSTWKDPNPFIAGDVTRERLLEIEQGHASYDEYFPGAPQEIIDEWKGYLKDLKDAPTGYFEAKPQRAVQMEEFMGAMVPSDTADDVLKILKKHGLDAHKYKDQAEIPDLLRKHYPEALFGAAGMGITGSMLADYYSNMNGNTNNDM